MQLLDEVGFPTPISNEVCDGIMPPGSQGRQRQKKLRQEKSEDKDLYKLELDANNYFFGRWREEWWRNE